jgi:tetrahydromethanopterin S-methyltransferase subunit G
MAFAAGSDPATKDDLKAVLQAIEKRFEQIDRRFEQIDKRFEQIDRRFEQIDKRLDFHQNLLLVLIAGMIGSPFIIDYLARRRDAADRKALDEARRAVIALRELSTKDKKVAEALRIAGLL